MRKIIPGILATAAIATLAFTAPEKKPTTYIVDTKTSTATWTGKKVTGEHTGAINLSSGSIESKASGNISGGTFQFDMTSITDKDITDPQYNAKLITHLKSDDFFSVEKNPTATFVITKAVPKSTTNYDITGKLTIKGITNEISFPAMVKMDKKTLVAVAKISVDRTKFDIRYGSKSFFEGIGDKAIDDTFELDVNIVATAK